MTGNKAIFATAFIFFVVSQAALAQSSSNGVYGGYVGSSRWEQEQNALARDRAMNAALAAKHGGNQGGCNQLPAGWAKLDATVTFPAAYGGYAGWVNMAELVPVEGDVDAFVKTGQGTGVFTRPALRAGADAVVSHMCAPGKHAYWMVVDSGMARVKIGRVDLGAGPGPYRVSLTAPPLK